MKIGDKVYILIDYLGYYKGDVGKIVKIKDNGLSFHVFVKGRHSTSIYAPNIVYSNTQIKPFNIMKFKVGDKVKILDNDDGGELEIDSVGEIIQINEDSECTPYEVRGTDTDGEEDQDWWYGDDSLELFKGVRFSSSQKRESDEERRMRMLDEDDEEDTSDAWDPWGSLNEEEEEEVESSRNYKSSLKKNVTKKQFKSKMLYH